LVDLLPMIAREHAERAAREVGIPAERLIRANEAVAAEGDRVPGDAGGRERPGLGELDERPEIERTPRDQPIVERLGARRVERAPAKESPVARVQRVERLVEARGRGRDAGTVLAGEDRELDREDP